MNAITAKRFLIAAMSCMAVLPFSAQAYEPAPDEYASAVIYVPSTNKTIYAFKPDKPHSAASLSKLVSALVFLDRNVSWTKAMKSIQADEVGGGRLRVNVGTRLTVRDWWNAAIGASVNNAMNVVARSTGLSNAVFVQRMNAKAKALGAVHSVFHEPTGMDEDNTTTASDMAKIAKAAFSSPDVRSASATKSHQYTLATTGALRTYNTTNVDFIDDPSLWTVGAKTGFLYESMYNLVAELQPVDANGVRNPKKDVIVVVLGAPSKASSVESVKRMADWAWTQEDAFKVPKVAGKRLSAGMTDPDVSRVQRILAQDKAVYADGRVTGFFGPLTVEAVKKFQVKYGIAKPGMVGYGQVGPNTWAKLIELE
ncbi:MAG: serine hydrolase [Patescibacteria group bacterium]